jgi:hypothetical protein
VIGMISPVRSSDKSRPGVRGCPRILYFPPRVGGQGVENRFLNNLQR